MAKPTVSIKKKVSLFMCFTYFIHAYNSTNEWLIYKAYDDCVINGAHACAASHFQMRLCAYIKCIKLTTRNKTTF